MPWLSAQAAASALNCRASQLNSIAKKRGIVTRDASRKLYRVPTDRYSRTMFRRAPVTALAEKWRQWAVDVGLIGEKDELRRIVIDIDVVGDDARFWVEREGDMRQLAVSPPFVKLEGE